MTRWVALLAGCVAALGMRVALDWAAGAAGLGTPAVTDAAVPALAVLLGGYVAGYLAGRWRVLNGALAASAYILVLATVAAVQDARLAAAVGVDHLAALDLPRLALDDLVALVAGSLGAWLSDWPGPRTTPTDGAARRENRSGDR